MSPTSADSGKNSRWILTAILILLLYTPISATGQSFELCNVPGDEDGDGLADCADVDDCPMGVFCDVYESHVCGLEVSCVPTFSLLWDVSQGSSLDDEGRDVVVAGDGSVYVTGYTYVTTTSVLSTTSVFPGSPTTTSTLFAGSPVATPPPQPTPRPNPSPIGTPGPPPPTPRPTPIPPENPDIWVLKFNPDGALLWDRVVDYGMYEYGSHVSVSSNGRVSVVGEVYDRIGPSVWSRQSRMLTYDSNGVLLGDQGISPGIYDYANDVYTAFDESIYATGASLDGFNRSDVFLLKFASTGSTLLWNRTFGGNGSDVGWGVVASPNGVFVSGFSDSFGEGDKDLLLLKYDFDGNLLWHRLSNVSLSDDAGQGISLGVGGNVVVTGYTTASPPDLWVLEFDSEGNLVRMRMEEINESEIGFGVWATNLSEVYTTGFKTGASGDRDLWLLKYWTTSSTSSSTTTSTSTTSTSTTVWSGYVVNCSDPDGNDTTVKATASILMKPQYCQPNEPRNCVITGTDQCSFNGNILEYVCRDPPILTQPFLISKYMHIVNSPCPASLVCEGGACVTTTTSTSTSTSTTTITPFLRVEVSPDPVVAGGLMGVSVWPTVSGVYHNLYVYYAGSSNYKTLLDLDCGSSICYSPAVKSFDVPVNWVNGLYSLRGYDYSSYSWKYFNFTLIGGAEPRDLTVTLTPNPVDKGADLTVDVYPGSEGVYRYVYIYDVSNIQKGNFVLPCANFKCEIDENVSYVYTVPVSWSVGEYYLRVYDYTSSGWGNHYFNVSSPPSCNDSDGGIVYPEFGWVWGVSLTGSEYLHNDSCSGATISEWYCSGVTPQVISTYECPGGCAGGACLTTTTTTTTLPSNACLGQVGYVITGVDVCSDQYSASYSCDKVSNGVTSDYWFGRATGAPKWTYGDLGRTKCVSGVRAWIYRYDVPQKMNVDVSDDGVSWRRVYSNWTVSDYGRWVDLSFSETSARFVRLYMTECKRSYCNLREYEVAVREFGGPVEVCDEPGDEDGDGLVDCLDPDCPDGVTCTPAPNVCSGGVCVQTTSTTTSTTTTMPGGCAGPNTWGITGDDNCSDQYSSTYACEKVSNGLTSDYWFGKGTGAPKWTFGDLERTKCVSGVRAWIYNPDVPQTMNVEVSMDGSSWTPVYLNWTVTQSERWVNLSFDESLARYVRLNMTSCKRAYCNLREYQVYSRNYTA
ncbi:MAG: discoidin domain-containing protein [Methanobacteriota archaeon]